MEVDLESVVAENTWEAAVFAHYKSACSGCGGDTRLAARLVVPEEQGGRRTLGNSTLLCLHCDLARSPAPGVRARGMDLQVSRRLGELIHTWPERQVFKGISGGLRQLMELYVAAPGRFPDLGLFQDAIGDDELPMQINFRVEQRLYDQFRDLAREAGLSVRAALVGVIMSYEEAISG